MTDFSDLTGEPALLKTYATRYLQIADAIQSASAALKAVGEGSDSMVSLAVNEVRGKAKKGGEDIGEAEARYRTTAQALLTYSGALEDAQSKAVQARGEYESARGSHATAQARANEFEDQAQVPGANQAADARSASTWSTQASNLASSMGSAQAKYNEAVAEKERAGNTAADAINTVISDDGISDSWWDVLVDFCEKIGDWVAIAALLLSWVPGLGQILLALAAIISIIKLIDSLLKFFKGEMSLGEVVGAAIGVVLSIVGGKALMVGLKGLKSLQAGSKAAKTAAKMASRPTSRNARQNNNKAQGDKRDAVKDFKDAFKPSKKDITEPLKDTFVKPFSDLGKALTKPGEASDFVKAVIKGQEDILPAAMSRGHDPKYLQMLGNATSNSVSFEDLPMSLRVEILFEGSKVFGGALETVSKPFIGDVPFTVESLAGQISKPISEGAGNMVDGAVGAR
jgi:gas vesicle protein